VARESADVGVGAREGRGGWVVRMSRSRFMARIRSLIDIMGFSLVVVMVVVWEVGWGVVVVGGGVGVEDSFVSVDMVS